MLARLKDKWQLGVAVTCTLVAITFASIALSPILSGEKGLVPDSISSTENGGSLESMGVLTSYLETVESSGTLATQPDLLVSSALTHNILRYDGITGAFVGVFASGGGLTVPLGLIFGPDGNLYVCSSATNSILRFDGTTGAFINVFVPPGSGGLGSPRDLVFGSDENLYVVNFQSSCVLRYDGTTGAFIDAFVVPGSGGLFEPKGLTFGPDGNLYVASESSDKVLRYDGTTGTFIDDFAVGGALWRPWDLEFGPDGNLYVGSFHGIVLRYDGTTGAYIDVFASGGGLSVPTGVLFGPDGNLYVGNRDIKSVLRYDGTTGTFIDQFVTPGSGGLNKPVFLAFIPELTVTAYLDIKPGSCPNSFNRKSNGFLPVALVGTESFDVTMVDISSILIARADGIGGSVAPNEGPRGPHSVLEDVATPFEGDPCDCHTLGGDGIMDLSMKFRTDDLVDMLELDFLPAGEHVELVVTGTLLDETPFSASDCIVLVPRRER